MIYVGLNTELRTSKEKKDLKRKALVLPYLRHQVSFEAAIVKVDLTKIGIQETSPPHMYQTDRQSST